MDNNVSDGINIALSPVQLAAILANENVAADASFSKRLWGGARIVGGVVELLGAGVLCAAPEPTMITKAGCLVVGVHGWDTTIAGTRQLFTGREKQTLTEYSASSLAEVLGADQKTAGTIGLTVDIAVPLGFAILASATRVASVRAGRLSLLKHEAQTGSRLGGHTITRHVGKTEAELRARLVAQRNIPAATSFSTIAVAEKVISDGLRMNAPAIRAWAQRAATQSRPQAFEFQSGANIGYGVIRASNRLVQLSKVRLVLKYEVYNNMPYYILTAFPIP